MQFIESADHLPRKGSLKKRKPSWLVRYGVLEWRRYTYDRTTESDLQLLGSIRKGLQVGALAKTRDGQYVMLVGDHETPLNSSQMEKVLKNNPREFQVPVATETKRPNVASSPPPVVIVKKRRVIVPA
jgi:hypothetical protein